MIKHLKESESLESLLTKDLTLVDFYAEWCGPCKMLGPVLEKLENINIIKVDVDIHQQLAMNYGIMSVPSLLFFKNGQLVKKEIGFRSEEDLKNIISNLK